MRNIRDKEIVVSGDGSYTLYSQKYEQSYHSITGAITEKVEKFVKAAGCIEKTREAVAKKRPLKVMDVCFGIGYNSMSLLYQLNKEKVTGAKIEIYAYENDKGILLKMDEIDVFPEMNNSYDFLKELKGLILKDIGPENQYGTGTRNGLFCGNEITLKLHVWDVREGIKEISGNKIWEKEGFDVVFFDPFSPHMCPELWTKEFLKKVYDLMRKGSVLTTYSCAGSVRRNLKEIGFQVKDGPKVGRRAPSTIAIKQ